MKEIEKSKKAHLIKSVHLVKSLCDGMVLQYKGHEIQFECDIDHTMISPRRLAKRNIIDLYEHDDWKFIEKKVNHMNFWNSDNEHIQKSGIISELWITNPGTRMYGEKHVADMIVVFKDEDLNEHVVLTCRKLVTIESDVLQIFDVMNPILLGTFIYKNHI